MSRGGQGEEEKGLLWKLPVVRTKELGKVGPAFGIGAGCDFGFGLGLIGVSNIALEYVQVDHKEAEQWTFWVEEMESEQQNTPSVSGMGFGPGFPGLQLGFGVGAGCGVGFGFGYGMGRGIAYDEFRRHSNVGKLFTGAGSLPTQDEIGALIDEVVISTKKLIKATSIVVDKWRRP